MKNIMFPTPELIKPSCELLEEYFQGVKEVNGIEKKKMRLKEEDYNSLFPLAEEEDRERFIKRITQEEVRWLVTLDFKIAHFLIDVKRWTYLNTKMPYYPKTRVLGVVKFGRQEKNLIPISVIILPSERGKGYARKVFQLALNECCERGAEAIKVDCGGGYFVRYGIR